MKYFFTWLLLCCCLVDVHAINITTASFSAYVKTAGPGSAATPTNGGVLQVVSTGENVQVDVVLQRPQGQPDQGGVFLYIGNPNLTVSSFSGVDIGSTAGATYTANRDKFTVYTSGTYVNNAYWYLDTTQPSRDIIPISNNTTFAFNLGITNPGVQVSNPAPGYRYLYVCVFDPYTYTVTSVSQGIAVNYTSPPPNQVPIINSISPTSAAPGTSVHIYGSKLSQVWRVQVPSKRGGYYSATAYVISDNEVVFTVPGASLTGALFVQTNSTSSNLLNFNYIEPSNSPEIVGFLNNLDQYGATYRPLVNVLVPGDEVRIYLKNGTYKLLDYGITAVDFAGTRVTGASLIFYSDNILIVRIPNNISFGPGKLSLITSSLGNSNGLDFRLPRPQTACAPNEVCGNQCVAYNGTPSILLGRLLANGQPITQGNTVNPNAYPGPFPALTTSMQLTEFLYYKNWLQDNLFADPAEQEEVQWQINYSSSDDYWQDIAGATGRDYQPGPLTQTARFRRVSTHMEHRCCFRDDVRAFWYTSNAITVNVIPPAPSFTSSSYGSCGNGSVIQIAVNPVQGAVSYNWWVPYQGWEVSTDGVNFTGFTGGSYIVPSTRIYVRVPAGTSGAYNIAASVNGTNSWTPSGPGLCDKSPDGNSTINVTPGNAAVGQPTGLRVVRNGTGCNLYYTVSMPVVAGTNVTYRATLDGDTQTGTVSGSNVLFPYTYYPDCYSVQSVSGTVTATGSCNSATTTVSLSLSPSKCSACRVAVTDTTRTTAATTAQSPAPAKQVVQGVYPNPANEELHLNFDGKETVVRLYNVTGALVRELTVQEGAADTTLQVQALPQGLYHLRTTQRDGRTESHQITITH